MEKTSETERLRNRLAEAIRGGDTDLSVFDPGDVLRAATQHGIAPLLARQVRDDGACRSRPGIAALRKTAHSQAAYDMLLDRNTARACRLMEKEEIPCLLLKGTALAHLHYSESWLRPRSDTDLYIRAEDTDCVGKLLSRNDFTVRGLGDRPQTTRQFLAIGPAFQGVRTPIDVHWRLSNRVLFRGILPFESCWESRQNVHFSGERLFAPCDVDLLLHACIHRIGHSRNTERNRLIWLFDIHLLYSALGANERERFAASALDYRIGAVCADGLIEASMAFETPFDPELLSDLGSRRSDEPTAGLLRAPRWRWALADLLGVEGIRNKIEFVREALSG